MNHENVLPHIYRCLSTTPFGKKKKNSLQHEIIFQELFVFCSNIYQNL